MNESITVNRQTYQVCDANTRFNGWNDSVGNSLAINAKQVSERFNYAQEKLWNQIKKVDNVDPNQFKYESVKEQIDSLECR